MNQFIAGIHVLVKKDNYYLVIKRSADDPEDPSHWDLPGGGIDIGEQPYDAAIRETQEEANILINNIRPLTAWAMPFMGKWSIEVLTEAEYVSGEVKLSTEHAEYKWVTKEELLSIEPKSKNLQAIFKISL